MKYLTFDLETSGLNTNKDHIMQIAMILSDSSFNTIEEYSTLVNPGCDFEVSPGALEKTGITREMVEESGTPIDEVLLKVEDMISKADALLTYNGNRFDIPFLYNTFARKGKILSLPDTILDALAVEQRHNSNKLVDTYRRYYGEDYSDAHDALADVKATIAVFKKQSELYEDAGDNTAFISPENMVEINPSTHMMVFRTGKYKDKTVYEVCCNDAGYIKWLYSAYNGTGCSIMLKTAIKNEYQRVKDLEKNALQEVNSL